jgi:hypothetical protein
MEHPDHPVLDWRPRFDERSRSFPVRALVPRNLTGKRLWDTGRVLDQGREGACVGFGWVGEELAGAAIRRTALDVTAAVGNTMARGRYARAKQLDEWPGESYEGTSVLAGAKATLETGAIKSYHWAFSINDIRNAVIGIGPVVIGVWWYEAMYEAPGGLVRVEGDKVGGHCLLLTGYDPNYRGKGPHFRWRNSWGHSYGLRGTAYISEFNLSMLTADDGEACVAQR